MLRAGGPPKGQPWIEAKSAPGADPATYKPLNHCWFVATKHVYFEGTRLEGANADELEIIEDYLARDGKHVYERGHIIPEADPRTCCKLNEEIALDAQHVFVSNEVQPQIDVGSFEHVGYDYFADQNGIYWQGKLIADADRRTFRALDYGRAKDRSTEYQDNQSPKKRAERTAPKTKPA